MKDRETRKRRRWLPVGISALSLGAVAAAVVPLVVPIRPLEGTGPLEDLIEPDSRFLDVEGVSVHYKVAGHGEPAFILLHGFAASVFSWREVTAPLAEMGTVLAFDRPASGLTARPLQWQGENPYSPEFQMKLVISMLDHLGVERGILVGSSAGGTVALNTALEYPERVRALVLVDPAVYTGGPPAWVLPVLRTPQIRRIGPVVARGFVTRGPDLIKLAWHDPSTITPDVLEGYKKPLKVNDWDLALWELIMAARPPELAPRLSEISVPTLVITGDDDRIVPARQSVRLSKELPGASLAVIPACGHLPHEERPHEFMRAVREFIGSLS